jgi:hypothetical protein
VAVSLALGNSTRKPAHWTDQSGVTILAEVLEGADSQLLADLEQIHCQVAASGLPFSRSDRIHYARFVFIRSDIDPLGKPLGARLMYLADFDGAVAEHLVELVKFAGTELSRIGKHLKQQIPSDPDGQLSWLRKHIIPNATYYVNTIGRTVEHIRRESELREQIQAYLDQINAPSCAPVHIREMI